MSCVQPSGSRLARRRAGAARTRVRPLAANLLDRARRRARPTLSPAAKGRREVPARLPQKRRPPIAQGPSGASLPPPRAKARWSRRHRSRVREASESCSLTCVASLEVRGDLRGGWCLSPGPLIGSRCVGSGKLGQQSSCGLTPASLLERLARRRPQAACAVKANALSFAFGTARWSERFERRLHDHMTLGLHVETCRPRSGEERTGASGRPQGQR